MPTATRTRTRKSADTGPYVAPYLEGVEGLTDEQSMAIRGKLEDLVVRQVRRAGHCDAALQIMRPVLGQSTLGANDRNSFYDSEGADCWNERWRDENGFDKQGFDRNGYNAEGFNRQGRDRDGFDIEGRDENGGHRDDLSRFMYDYNGRTIDGWDRDGRNRGTGRTREEQTQYEIDAVDRFIYDCNGRSFEGYTHWGEGRDGQYNSFHNYSDYPDRRREAYERLQAARAAAGTVEPAAAETEVTT